ncbi:MAG: putative lipid II flippase FtsW, partial [Vulcanimicrobiaceae bacterium]
RWPVRVAEPQPARPADGVLIAAVAALVAFGLIMIFSASSAYAVAIHHDATYFLKRQLAWLLVALGGAFVAYRIDYRRLRRVAPWFFGLALVGLVAVLVPHVGLSSGGARRWLGVGPLGFEPSEFAKPALVIYLAATLAAKGERIRSFASGVAPAVLASALAAMLVVREPDLGTASLLVFSALTMLFVAGARLVHLTMLAVPLIPATIFIVRHDPYKFARITAFLNPWADPRDKGFHIVQSLLALGSGGWFGVGLGFSRQKYFWLPEAHTDFIASIVGEELGYLGMLVLLALFILVAYRAVRIALHAPDRFGFLLAIGATALLLPQALINVGVVSSSWPVTGVPLPFISFGGSSLVVSLVAVALILNVGRARPLRRPAVRPLPATQAVLGARGA